MSRSARLLQLLEILRRHRYPVTGQLLATELGISLRTLYRDIATLQAQGAEISGEAGQGYVLRPGFTLPPLMFSPEEIEALVLGARWVAARGDPRLAAAAGQALERILAVMPPPRRAVAEQAPLLVGSAGPQGGALLAQLRQAIRGEHKLRLLYRDLAGQDSERIVWPFALGFFTDCHLLAAWCEHRDDFRNFRTDRILGLTALPERYPRARQVLLAAWHQQEGIPLGIPAADKN